MEKLKVNSDICIGCGACAATYPDIFIFNDEGTAEVVEDQQLQSEDIVEEATGICPVGAICSENEEN